MKELKNKILKDTFIVMLSNIINYAGMFILAVMVTRLLGVTSLGEFTYIFAVSSVLSVVTEFGLSQLLIRKINGERANIFFIVKNVNLFKLLLSLICAAAACLIFFVIPGNIFSTAFVAGIAVIIPKSFQSTYESAIRALMKQTLPSVLKSANTLAQIILAYFILIRYENLFYLFIMMFVMESITAMTFQIACRKVWKNTAISFSSFLPYSPAQIKALVKESFPFFGSNFLALSIPRVIIIILGSLSSQISLGIYSAASRFANGVGLFSGALYNTFYPAMTDPGTAQSIRYRLAWKFTFYAFMAGLVISLIIYFSADMLIDLTFRIPEAVPVLKLMGFTVIPVLTHSVIQSYLLSQKFERFILYFYIVLWIFNLAACFFLVKFYGYWGAAISAATFEYIVMITLFILFIKQKKNGSEIP